MLCGQILSSNQFYCRDLHVIDNENLARRVAQIVAAYSSRNLLPHTELQTLIKNVGATLLGLNGGIVPSQEEKLPAVPIKKSLTDDWIICLEDGKKFKSLRRHLMSSFNLTPEAYRKKWGLPADYPMVAPNYSKRRSGLAKEMGLGRPDGTGKGRKGKRRKG